jgi:transposase InsO family protein
MGPLPTAQGNYKYAAVAVEYFTKWIEAKPLVSITSAPLKKFFWQNIICRFGDPREIILDNAKQFDCDLFKDFCYQMGTEAAFASVYHPQSNGAVERANTLIFTSIKKCLENQKKGNGQGSCRRQSGATTPPSLEQPIPHLSSYYSVKKQ